MQFLKKNYEKILLGLVLAGLIGMLVFMLFYIASDEQAMSDHGNAVINPPAAKLPDLDLTTESNAAARMQSPYALDLETGNKVFNPMEWRKAADGSMVPVATLGAAYVVVTNIQPLYLILTLKSVTTNEFGTRYLVTIERQAEKSTSKRRPSDRYVSVGDKNDVFSLLSIKGSSENPDALVVKLLDSGDTVSVVRGQPYKRTDAYIADFLYNPEKKVFLKHRVGDKAYFNNMNYDVVDIGPDELTLLDESNQKKTTLRFSP
jgi:hypothetical protein